MTTQADTVVDEQARKQQQRDDYIAARWTQLADACTTWDEEALKYLLAVNAAGLAGALSFVGAFPSLGTIFWAKAVIALFAAGLALVGVYHLVRHHRTRWIFRVWRRDVAEHRVKPNWNKLRDNDTGRSERLMWPLELIFHASMACFFAAICFAAVNIDDISKAAKEKANERAQNTIATPAAAGSRATSERNAGRAARGGSAAETRRHGYSKSSDTGSRRNAAPSKQVGSKD